MSSNIQNQNLDQYSGYKPAHDPHVAGKDQALKYEFDSPSTIAKQQLFQQAGGPQFQQVGGFQQQGFSAAPPPPALPKVSAIKFLGERRFQLKLRDWNAKPWNNTQGVYTPPSYSSQNSSLTRQSSFGSLQRSTSSGSLGAYQPSSTIPLQHNYQLPHSGLSQSSTHSQLSQSSIPSQFTAPLSKNLGGQQFQQQSNFNAPLSKDLGGQQFQNQQFQQGGLPAAPAIGFGQWQKHSWGQWRNNRQSRPVRPLRLRNWGTRNESGWSGFNRNSAIEESFLSNRQQQWQQDSWNQQGFSGQPGFANIPQAPALPSRQRKWTRGPYRMRAHRSRNWGTRNENGWSGFNSNQFNQSILPFNSNSNLKQLWLSEKSLNQNQSSRGLSNIQQQNSFSNISAAPISSISNISAAPIAAPIAAVPVIQRGGPAGQLTTRSGRRAAKKAAKQAAIQQKLTTNFNTPIGDPAVNHYRRGAHATVPMAGPLNGGIAPPTGSIVSRRRGRRNNLGRRRNRIANPAIPVAATQPPFVAPIAAPVAAPIGQFAPSTAFPSATYRTVYSQPSLNSSFSAQPASAFHPASTYAPTQAAGIPIATAQAPLYNNAQVFEKIAPVAPIYNRQFTGGAAL